MWLCNSWLLGVYTRKYYMKRNFRGPIFFVVIFRLVSDHKNFTHKILSHGWRHGQPIAYTNLFWPQWRLQWQAVSWTHSVLGLSVTRMFLTNRSILYAFVNRDPNSLTISSLWQEAGMAFQISNHKYNISMPPICKNLVRKNFCVWYLPYLSPVHKLLSVKEKK